MNETRDIYTVSEIQTKLALGKNKAYQLCTSGVFPYKRIGKTIIIPKKPFDHWLNSCDENIA